MFNSALNLLRSGSEHVGNSLIQKAVQGAGNLLGKAVDIGDRYLFPMYKYNDRIDKWFNALHGISTRQVIEPSPNASFGAGSFGPTELAPAFVGDKQELSENKEKIEHNPVGDSIFRKTDKKMPVSLSLPSRERRKVPLKKATSVEKKAPVKKPRRKINYKVEI